MKHPLLGILAILPMLCAPQAALAKKEMAEAAIHLEQVPAALQADAAYILVKASVAKSGLFAIQHVLLREPSEQELADYLAAKQIAYEAELPKLRKKAKNGERNALK